MPPKKKTLFRRLTHRFAHSWPAYALLSVLIVLVDALPVRAAHWLGRLGGRLVFWLDRRHRNICLANTAIAFPEKSERERLRIVRDSYRHLGLCVVDFCRFRSAKPEDIRRLWVVPEDGADERMRQALARGAGIIGVAGHVGFWELSGFVFPSLGYPLVSISKRIHAPRVEALVLRQRQLLGNQVFPKEGALRPLLRALHDNKTVGIIMDQYGGRDSPKVPFFGRPAPTVDSCARLHLKIGAPVLLNLMMRRPDGRYTWRCRTIETTPSAADEDGRILEILAACNRELAQAIREYPEQWLWMHKRWR